MSFSAGAITGILDLDMNPFAQGMLQAEGISKLFPNVVTQFLADPLLGLAQVAVDVGNTIKNALVDAFDAVKGDVEWLGHLADNMGETAQKIGVSTEFLSTMGRVAQDAGSSLEGLGDSLKFLNRNAADAMMGNKDAADAFAALGINILGMSGQIRPTEDLFYDLVDALNAIPDPAVRTKYAMDLLGRGGNDLQAVIAMGSGELRNMAGLMKELGAGVDENLAKAGDKFGTLETIVGAAWDGIKRAVAEPILQIIADHFEQIKNVVVEVSAAIRHSIQATWDWAKDVFQRVKPEFDDLMNSMRQLFHTMLDFQNFSIGRMLTDGLVEGLKIVLEVVAKILDAINMVIQAFQSLLKWLGMWQDATNVAVSGPSASSSGTPSSSPNAPGGGNAGVPVTVNQTNHFNLNEQRVAAEIAKKTEPVVRAAQWQAEQRAALAAKQAAVASGLGGGQ